MTPVRCALLTGLAVLVGGPSIAAAGEGNLEIETGIVFSGRNDTRSPGNTGTTLSLTDELSTDPTPVFRLRAGVRLGDRHVVTALYAPLRLTARGSVDRDIQFNREVVRSG